MFIRLRLFFVIVTMACRDDDKERNCLSYSLASCKCTAALSQSKVTPNPSPPTPFAPPQAVPSMSDASDGRVELRAKATDGTRTRFATVHCGTLASALFPDGRKTEVLNNVRLLARLLAIASKRAAHALDVTMRLAARNPRGRIKCDDFSVGRSCENLLKCVFGATPKPRHRDRASHGACADEAALRGFRTWQSITKLAPLARRARFTGIKGPFPVKVLNPLAHTLRDAVVVRSHSCASCSFRAVRPHAFVVRALGFVCQAYVGALPAQVASTVRAIMGSKKCSKRIMGIGKKLLRQAAKNEAAVKKAKDKGTWMEETEAGDILQGVIETEYERLWTTCQTKRSNRQTKRSESNRISMRTPTRAGGVSRCPHVLLRYWCTRQLSHAAACARV